MIEKKCAFRWILVLFTIVLQNCILLLIYVSVSIIGYVMHYFIYCFYLLIFSNNANFSNESCISHTHALIHESIPVHFLFRFHYLCSIVSIKNKLIAMVLQSFSRNDLVKIFLVMDFRFIHYILYYVTKLLFLFLHFLF